MPVHALCVQLDWRRTRLFGLSSTSATQLLECVAADPPCSSQTSNDENFVFASVLLCAVWRATQDRRAVPSAGCSTWMCQESQCLPCLPLPLHTAAGSPAACLVHATDTAIAKQYCHPSAPWLGLDCEQDEHRVTTWCKPAALSPGSGQLGADTLQSADASLGAAPRYA